jgi:hypothetical protein
MITDPILSLSCCLIGSTAPRCPRTVGKVPKRASRRPRIWPHGTNSGQGSVPEPDKPRSAASFSVPVSSLRAIQIP